GDGNRTGWSCPTKGWRSRSSEGRQRCRTPGGRRVALLERLVGDSRWLAPGEQPTAGGCDDGQADEDEKEVEDRHVAHPLGELASEERGRGEVGDGRAQQGAEQAKSTGG